MSNIILFQSKLELAELELIGLNVLAITLTGSDSFTMQERDVMLRLLAARILARARVLNHGLYKNRA